MQGSLWCIVCLYLGDEQHHSEKVGTRQVRSHLMVRTCLDFLCTSNSGAQPCSSREWFPEFVLFDLFTYLFCLGSPVGLLSIEILIPKEDHSFLLLETLWVFCAMGVTLNTQHPLQHCKAEVMSQVYSHPNTDKPYLNQIHYWHTLLAWDSWPKKVAWILVWLSNTLVSIPYHILK